MAAFAIANRHLAAFLLCMFAAAALALLQPGPANVPGPVRISSGALAAPALLEGARPDWRRVRPGPGVAWLSGNWRPDRRDEAGAPTAFRISGLFSAELYWNGRLIGRKGRPSADPAQEVPGPIDSAIVIPGWLIEEGNNRWALRISSHHAGYQTPAAIQEVEIGPYRGSGRGLGYYLPALLLFGGIAAAGAAASARFAAGGGARSAAIAASAALLAAAMGAEVSRALVNYGYDWHLYRQLATLLLLAGHAGFLITALLPEAPKSLAARGVAIAAAVGAVLAFLLGSGFDQKIGWMLSLSYGAILLLSALRRHSSRPAVHMGAVATAGLVFLTVNLADFLNAGAYGFGLALLLVALRTGRPASEAAGRGSGPGDRSRLLVACAGGERIVCWSDVYCLRASGNRTEVTLRGGAFLLDRRGLGRILRTAPAGILRVHRSFAANVEHAAGVETLSRGSYRLLLADGRHIPLARASRACIRDAIARRAAAPRPEGRV